MLYAVLAFLVAGLIILGLGFFGIIRGAAGFVNLAFLASLVCLAVAGLTNYWRRQMHR